jgi:hypothetical protein
MHYTIYQILYQLFHTHHHQIIRQTKLISRLMIRRKWEIIKAVRVYVTRDENGIIIRDKRKLTTTKAIISE